MRLWDPATGQPLHTLQGHRGRVYGVAFSPDSQQLATASDDGTLRLWDPATGQPLHTLQRPPSRVYGVAFSPDSQQLATVGDDGTVRLWDPATGQPLHTLQGHRGRVYGVAFSPDGQQLATASNDGTLRLWDPNLGIWLATLLLLTEGWAVLTRDGGYKLEGIAGGELWWAVGLCRLEPGELDPYVPSIRRLLAEAPLSPATE